MRINLMGNLYALVDLWVATHAESPKRISPATLGARVHKDAKLFERLEQGGSIAVPRFEALVEYLADPASWPGGVMPDRAAAQLRRLGIVQPGERLVVERDTVEREVIGS